MPEVEIAGYTEEIKKMAKDEYSHPEQFKAEA